MFKYQHFFSFVNCQFSYFVFKPIFLTFVVICCCFLETKFVVIISFSASFFNDWAMTDSNWQRFSNQNYFNRQGTFLAVIFSGPLIINAIIILVNFVVELGGLLVAVKRGELKRKMQSKKNDKDKKQSNKKNR